MKYKIAIIGSLGMVGRSLKRYFQKQNKYELFFYDIAGEGSIEEINRADYIYLAVPTPTTEKGCDISALNKVLSDLDGEKVVIIKSTIIPGTTANLQKEFPQHKILFNPEFLTEETADKDFEIPDKQIIGYTEKSRDMAKIILDQLPKAPLEKIVPSYVAEFIKYASNTYFSVKVAKNNELYDVFKKFGGSDKEFEDITEALIADPRIGNSHFKIWHNSWRGYGGKCLPKDTKAFIEFAKDLGVDTPITISTDSYNDKLVSTFNRNRDDGQGKK